MGILKGEDLQALHLIIFNGRKGDVADVRAQLKAEIAKQEKGAEPKTRKKTGGFDRQAKGGRNRGEAR